MTPVNCSGSSNNIPIHPVAKETWPDEALSSSTPALHMVRVVAIVIIMAE